MRTFIAATIAAIASAQEASMGNSMTFAIAATEEVTSSQVCTITVYPGTVMGDDSDARIMTSTVHTSVEALATNNIVQQWCTWKGFSDDGMTNQYTVQNIQVTSSGDGTATNNVTCGTEMSLAPTTNWSNTKGTTTSGCTNPWFTDEGVRKAMNGEMTATFEAYRPFSYSTAKTIKMGDMITMMGGFAHYSTPSTAVTPTNVGASGEMTWMVSDSASMLTLSAAAAAIISLSF